MDESNSSVKSPPSEQIEILNDNKRKENGNIKWYRDSKNIISLVALIISIISFAWTYYNAMNERNRWKVINMGDVEITDAAFIMQKLIAKNEALIM